MVYTMNSIITFYSIGSKVPPSGGGMQPDLINYLCVYADDLELRIQTLKY